MKTLQKVDADIFRALEKETNRQRDGLELIPSENYTSRAVMEAVGSILTNKYSEGYPGKRYYGGNEYIDDIEVVAKERAVALFHMPHANVQPYSGSPANHAVYMALCRPGDTVMGMQLVAGGHLTHGVAVNFSGHYYRAVHYGVDVKTGRIDYDEVLAIAKREKPKLIWAGATAYPRRFDWKKFKTIADDVGAYLACDVAHYAGLIAGDAYPSPAGACDVMTMTSHKTLRGPRGALILTTKELAKKIDKAVFPGLQGGPHDHVTAGIAVCLKEAASQEFKTYADQVVKNAAVFARALVERGYHCMTGGTDNHLLLIDLTNKGITGQTAQDALGRAGITVNKNTVPGEKRSPFDPSGIRLGTPAITTRGMSEREMEKIAAWIDAVLSDFGNTMLHKRIAREIQSFCCTYPVPGIA